MYELVFLSSFSSFITNFFDKNFLFIFLILLFVFISNEPITKPLISSPFFPFILG